MRTHVILSLVAFVAIVGLVATFSHNQVIEMDMVATGQVSRTIERGGGQECDKLSAKVSQRVFNMIDKTEEYNLKWALWSKTTKNFALFMAQNYTNHSSWQYHNHTPKYLYYKEEIRKLEVHKLKLKKEITKIHAEINDLSLQASSCFLTTYCPPCPGESQSTLKSKCEIHTVQLEEYIASLDALFIDVEAEWSNYEKETKSTLLYIETQANLTLNNNLNHSNITTAFVHSSWTKSEKFKKKAIDLHIAMVKIKETYRKIMQEYFRCVTRNCPPCDEPKDKITTSREQIVTEPVQDKVETQREVTTTQPKQLSCPEICDSQGLTNKYTDWSSYIEGQLNSAVCVKQAKMSLGTMLRVGECVCFPKSKPKIDFAGSIQCESPCGTVECNGQKECPCPGKDNCVLRVKCLWGGWKKVRVEPPKGIYQYTPQVKSGS